MKQAKLLTEPEFKRLAVCGVSDPLISHIFVV